MDSKDILYKITNYELEEILQDLLLVMPSWRDVDLTKKGYQNQYLDTLIKVALYVREREKKAVKESQDETV